ncbi:ABC transporter ATP-binding protein [Nocardioides ginsengisoli]|uniref:ABC transporter ATP-binding protein n=1 Tax=Nocardioides ginsengisoli TaxID=363868 RepID=A0ABW3VUL9_9ACTN
MPANGLTVVDLTHAYGTEPVLRRVSLTVGSGTSAALMGPSGCGKTTLLLAAAGILVPEAGRVLVAGETVPAGSADSRAAFRRSRVGLVFQFGELIAELTLEQNVALAAELGGVRRRQALHDAREVLVRVGLSAVRGHKPGTVSGGQAQRAAIARAIVHRPELVLADEPTGALDSANGDAVLDLLLELVAERGATLLVVTHDERVARRCDRRIVMSDGRIVDG